MRKSSVTKKETEKIEEMEKTIKELKKRIEELESRPTVTQFPAISIFPKPPFTVTSFNYWQDACSGMCY